MTPNVRRRSIALDVARSRWQGLVSQDPDMDLGNGLTAKTYESSIAALEKQLLRINNLAADIQTARAIMHQMEREMSDLNDRFMKATAAKFGTSSMEVLAIGGVPKIERKRRSSMKPPSPSTPTNGQ